MKHVPEICASYREAGEQHPEGTHDELVEQVIEHNSLLCFRSIDKKAMNRIVNICRSYLEVLQQHPEEGHDGIVRQVIDRHTALDKRRQRRIRLVLAAGAVLLIGMLWMVAK